MAGHQAMGYFPTVFYWRQFEMENR